MEVHEKYMRRCLELARKGLGKTRQNPLVGSVIVYRDRIIGEGYHHVFGGPHAEVHAINSVRDHEILKKSTLYVNLEPCSHYGKTPPCSLLIRQKKIPHVVVGCTDPNPRVAGQGISMLKRAGTVVVQGVLEEESRWLNRRFIKYITTGKPYVILKWAESSDGFLDRIRVEGDENRPNWITNQTARMLVHKWRSEEAGIMAGVNTVLTDNPRLDVRDWSGTSPVRIIVDRHNRIGHRFNVKDGNLPTIVITNDTGENLPGIRYIEPGGNFSLSNILNILGKEGIISVMVEGGAMLLSSFLKEDLWDEARVFTGNAEFKAGVKAPAIRMSYTERILFRNNALKIYQRSDL